jgi:hypothetical protein
MSYIEGLVDLYREDTNKCSFCSTAAAADKAGVAFHAAVVLHSLKCCNLHCSAASGEVLVEWHKSST